MSGMVRLRQRRISQKLHVPDTAAMKGVRQVGQPLSPGPRTIPEYSWYVEVNADGCQSD
jgi:hypothetical protein